MEIEIEAVNNTEYKLKFTVEVIYGKIVIIVEKDEN